MENGQPSWRVVVFSNVDADDAVPAFHGFLREHGHRLIAVVTTPGPRSRRSETYLKVVASGREYPGVDVIVSNHPARWARLLEALAPDLLISAVFPWRIPPEALAVARLGGLNYHPSPLPKYRGPNPIGWAIRNRDEHMYVTIHRLTAEFDAGPILAQDRFALLPDDDMDTITPKIEELLVSKVLPEALERVAAGDAGTPQDESQASPAPVFEAAWRAIDWRQPRELIHRQIRSWVGDREIPRGALACIDGRPVVITKARILNAESELTPGAVCARCAGGSLVIQCGDGPLEILAYETLAHDTAASATAGTGIITG